MMVSVENTKRRERALMSLQLVFLPKQEPKQGSAIAVVDVPRRRDTLGGRDTVERAPYVYLEFVQLGLCGGLAHVSVSIWGRGHTEWEEEPRPLLARGLSRFGWIDIWSELVPTHSRFSLDFEHVLCRNLAACQHSEDGWLRTVDHVRKRTLRAGSPYGFPNGFFRVHTRFSRNFSQVIIRFRIIINTKRYHACRYGCVYAR